jgi:predicted DsbA family dithiol-disulfide isomerase
VDDDWRRCATFGVNAVPTFHAGRYLMVGAQPYEELERLIEHVLKEPGEQNTNG